MTSLFGVCWCSITICVASTFAKVNKSSSRKTSPVSKEVVVHIRLHFTQTESRETNLEVESPSEWTSISPVVETSESINIEPSDNDLELNTWIGYKFSQILQPEM